MNVWLTRAALRVRGLPPSARVVLLAHADACRPSGRTCLAGLEELAQACELSPKHVMRLRAQLIDAGHLRRLAAAHPGQRPVYEVLPTVPIPLPTGPGRSTPTPDHVPSSGRTASGNESQACEPPYKPQGITPPTPPPTRSADPIIDQGGREISTRRIVDHSCMPIDLTSTSPPDAAVLASAAI